MFVLPPERLRELLIKKATDVMWDKAASKIQNWFLGRLRRRAFLKRVKDNVRAATKVQQLWRWWVQNVLRPRQKFEREEKATKFIQQRLRGYQARRAILLVKANFQAEQLHDHYRRIDQIMRGRFQRRVRKAWFAYKERKAEKARKKAEAEAAKKKKRPARRAAAPAAPASTTSKPPTSTAGSATKPPALARMQSEDATALQPALLNTTGALEARRNTTVVLQEDILNITMQPQVQQSLMLTKLHSVPSEGTGMDGIREVSERSTVPGESVAGGEGTDGAEGAETKKVDELETIQEREDNLDDKPEEEDQKQPENAEKPEGAEENPDKDQNEGEGDGE